MTSIEVPATVEQAVERLRELCPDYGIRWAYMTYGTDDQEPRVFGPYDTQDEAAHCRFVEPLAKGTDGYVLPMIEPYREEATA
jgi:hypothetical protein